MERAIRTIVGNAMASSPKRTIAFLVSQFPSHIFSTTGLARALLAKGFEVEYWGPESVRKIVRPQGFAHFPISSIWSAYERSMPAGWRALLYEPRGSATLLWSLRERLERLDGELTQFEQSLDVQLRRRAPDLVLLDPFAAAYYPMLRARGIRCILLQDKPPPIPDPLVPPPTSHYCPRNTRASELAVRLAWQRESCRRVVRSLMQAAAGGLGFYTHEALTRAVIERVRPAGIRFKARRRVRYDLYFDELEEWVLGTPETDLPRSLPLPQHVRYIGSWVDLERPQSPIALPDRSAGIRTVYISMGAVVVHWSLDLPLWHRILDALSGIPDIALYASTGNLQTLGALRSRYPAFHFASFLPQVALLKHADLAITHVGANSFRECVSTGTPMLAFPREYDQHGNSARVVHHGVGLRGHRRWDDAANIRLKIRALLEDQQFAARASALNTAVLAANGGLLEHALQAVFGSCDEPEGRIGRVAVRSAN